MSWIVVNIHWIMILSGVLTMTMVYAALAPDAALRSTFGESVSGPVADIVVRNWGALIALVGAMLIFAARKPVVRPMALTVAGAAKAIFVALVLSHGGWFLGYQAGIAVLVDVLWVMIFRRVPAVGAPYACGRPQSRLGRNNMIGARLDIGVVHSEARGTILAGGIALIGGALAFLSVFS